MNDLTDVVYKGYSGARFATAIGGKTHRIWRGTTESNEVEVLPIFYDFRGDESAQSYSPFCWGEGRGLLAGHIETAKAILIDWYHVSFFTDSDPVDEVVKEFPPFLFIKFAKSVVLKMNPDWTLTGEEIAEIVNDMVSAENGETVEDVPDDE